MTRESRHLHVANVPAVADDQRLVDFFSSFGRVQKINRLDANSAVVSFMDVRSAQKANGEHRFDADLLRASFYEQESAVNQSKK
uniref:RRM domain-containing protein n=1 Tax=Plectus sambesii TaxID=2011161 RepID=A0A914W272_9BILA